MTATSNTKWKHQKLVKHVKRIETHSSTSTTIYIANAK